MTGTAEANTELNEYIKYLKERIFFEPLAAPHHYNLGLAYVRKGLPDAAISEFKQALACDPQLAQAYVNLGGLYFQKGDLDQCIEANQKALSLDPGLPMAHSNLGFAHLQRGEFMQAIAACRRAIELAPELLQAHNNLAVAYLQTDDQEASIAASLRVLGINERFVPGALQPGRGLPHPGRPGKGAGTLQTGQSPGLPCRRETWRASERVRPPRGSPCIGNIPWKLPKILSLSSNTP